MHLRLGLVVLAACGRVGFDPLGVVGPDDGGPIGHDEDGDGIGDVDDVCPHLPGSQLDQDGDGVGDDCDPSPEVARDSRVLFATMTATDQPFTLTGSGGWSQGADAILFDGAIDGQVNLALPFGEGRIALGADITDVIGAAAQHQFAVGISPDMPPSYFAEFNENPGFSWAAITVFDGSSYMSPASRDLPSRIHTGPVMLQVTYTLGDDPKTVLDHGWPGESYHLELASPGYTGGSAIRIALNNLEVSIRYVFVVKTE